MDTRETRSFPGGDRFIQVHSSPSKSSIIHQECDCWWLYGKAIAVVGILAVRHFSPLLTPRQKARAPWKKLRFYKRLLHGKGLSWHSAFALFLSLSLVIFLCLSVIIARSPCLARCQGCINFLFFFSLLFFLYPVGNPRQEIFTIIL